MKIVNNLTKATIKNYPCFNVREDLNFEDDGNHFKGFDYKGILPITTIRSDGLTFLDVRVDYIYDDYSFTSAEWHNQPEWRLCDEFNGCKNIDIDKLIENCETIIKAINRLNAEVKDEVIDTNGIKEKLEKEIAFAESFVDNLRGIDWLSLPDYNLREIKRDVDGIKRYTSRAKDVLKGIDNFNRSTKKEYLDRLKEYNYIILGETDYYFKRISEVVNEGKTA